MKFAREGHPFIAGGIVLAAAAYYLAWRMQSWPFWAIAFIFTAVALWVPYFFRDPERTGPRGDRVVISPADGHVLPITEIDEPNFIRGKAVRISIFMNIFSVHVNRYPIEGTVNYVHYNPGEFLAASRDKASLVNEQMSVGIESSKYRVLVRQIAGLIARRIITYSKHGDHAAQGQRFGLIRFGSRVDVFVPAGSTILVKEGMAVSAGTTQLAELRA